MNKDIKRNTKALLVNTVVVLLSTVIGCAISSIDKPAGYINHTTNISINVNVKDNIKNINK